MYVLYISVIMAWTTQSVYIYRMSTLTYKKQNAPGNG